MAASRPKRRERAIKWIGVSAARAVATADALAGDRNDSRDREATAFLPLELCPGLNAFAEMRPWQRKRIKRQALALMVYQCGRRATPLPGRPTVRLTRFSSIEPDAHSAWSKVPVDCLVVSWVRGGKRHDGLGWLEDDRPSKVELVTRWKPAPPGQGFVMVEVFAGTGQQCARGGGGATERVGGVSE